MEPTPGEWESLVATLATTLRAAGCVFAEEEAKLLVEAAADSGELAALTRLRVAGQPLEHLLGWAEFGGLRIRVGPGVFVPRRRSLLLVELAAGLAPVGGVALDLCCGSGALGALLARRRPDLSVYAAELDPVAVGWARRNLPPERVFEGDLYAALPAWLAGTVDVVVANAPYVPTGEIAFMPSEARDHEPGIALDGGADGLALHRRVAAGAPAALAPRGAVLIETSRSQAEGTAALLAAAGLRTRVWTDDELDGTAVVGTVGTAAADT